MFSKATANEGGPVPLAVSPGRDRRVDPMPAIIRLPDGAVLLPYPSGRELGLEVDGRLAPCDGADVPLGM